MAIDIGELDELTQEQRAGVLSSLASFNPIAVGPIANTLSPLLFDIYNSGTIAIPIDPEAITSISSYSNYVGGIVNLFDLNSLSTCDLSYNLLTAIEIANCNSLSLVYCGENPTLSHFKVKNCENLSVVNLSSSSITSVDFSQTTNLTTIHCNGIAVLESVNISGCKKLNYINFSGCNLSQVEIDKILKFCSELSIYSGVCSLSSGTNAPPSAQGELYKTDLTTYPKSWVVLTN